jgi:hypothetical protein
MLITPPRSENIPPRAASMSGVDNLSIDGNSDRFMMFRIWIVSDE